MRRKLKKLSLLLLLFFTNCTKNNGNIGDIFGLWSLVSLTEGDYILLEDNNMFIGFQSSVATLRIVNEMTNLCDESYGTFLIDDNDTIRIKISNGNIGNYKDFLFDANPINIHILVDKKELLLKSGNKTWLFEKH